MMVPRFALVALLLLAGCSGGGGQSTGSGSTPTSGAPTPGPPPASTPPPPVVSPLPVERDVAPLATNPAISRNLAAHVAVTPPASATLRGKLLVMLPGSGTPASPYRLILRTAAASGVHAVALTYPNDQTVADICAGPGPDCPGDVRREIITGEDRSSRVAVSPADSIEGRLRALIAYLHATYPAEGWDRFLFGGNPDWQRIIVAGHSQGAGHAAYIGKLWLVDRVGMFGGPGEAPGTSWLDLPAATPPERMYGLAHQADELVSLSLALGNWDRLGLSAFGGSVLVDGQGAPYGGSRMLVTAVVPTPVRGVAAPNHSAMIVDALTPLDGTGAPILAPVWRAMLFP